MDPGAPTEEDLLAAAGPVQVLDTLPTAAPLLEGGAARLSHAVLGAVAGQIESTTAELKFFETANSAASADYDKVLSDVAPIAAFHAELAAERAALEPHLKLIAVLEEAVGRLEGAVAQLDTQARQLEIACSDAAQE